MSLQTVHSDVDSLIRMVVEYGAVRRHTRIFWRAPL